MTQEHRYRCEVRYLLQLAKTKQQDAYLELVAKKRGKPEADRMREAARAEWILGNRGAKGEWHGR